ncbi:MAG: hypothetical protein A2Z20_06430 [Bdellovibrionales bacterium RBG_16_40_8]|nr:MAG: hypothetical protein A2Z20_06430 [Bdellovibrionales bacterium RBG_16_40_8]
MKFVVIRNDLSFLNCFYAQIESGRKVPSISTLKQIALALDIEIAILFASDDVHVFDMKRLGAKISEGGGFESHPTCRY